MLRRLTSSTHHFIRVLYKPLVCPKASLSTAGVTRGDSVIELHNVTSRLPDQRLLFEDVNISLLSSTVVGVVGPNGAGKSTFLKILAGRGTFDGRVAIRPSTRVTYLAQEPELDESTTVRDNVAAGGGDAFRLLQRFEEVNESMASTKGDALDALLEEQSELLASLDACDAWSLEQRVGKAMQALSLPPPSAIVSSLSGGERRRVALCRALMEAPDVLLLDEPTNHLDANSVTWLEAFLKEFKGAVVMVTHDRSLLEALAEWVVDVEYGKLAIYEGNYSKYLEHKAKLLDSVKAKEAALGKSLAAELAFVRSNRKGGGGAARLRRFEELSAEAADAGARAAEMVQGTIVLPPPRKRLGGRVLQATGLGCTLPNGRTLFQDVSFELEPGAIVGVVGRNGCGKTTLFNMLAGGEGAAAEAYSNAMAAARIRGVGEAAAREEGQAAAKATAEALAAGRAASGTTNVGTVKRGDTVSLGLVSQSRDGLDANKTVLEEISEGEDILKFGDKLVPVRQYIASFALKGPAQGKKVGVLSGGERNRVHLAKVLKEGHNVLLLDEPTNDLDVQTLRALEDALLAFAGTAVVISHDRWFLDRICTHTLAFEDVAPYDPATAHVTAANANATHDVVFYPGSFSEYRESIARNAKRAARESSEGGSSSGIGVDALPTSEALSGKLNKKKKKKGKGK